MNGLGRFGFPLDSQSIFFAQLTFASKDEKRRERVVPTRVSPPPKDW